MKTPTDTWIAFEDRSPTPEDFNETHGVELFRPQDDWREVYYAPSTDPSYGGSTYWRRVELPPLPTKEQSQEDKDDITCHKWLESRSVMSRDECRTTWHVAIAHERSHLGGMSTEQFVKELREIADRLQHCSLSGSTYQAYHALRALLDRAAKG